MGQIKKQSYLSQFQNWWEEKIAEASESDPVHTEVSGSTLLTLLALVI